jgi:hypothetical protein
MAVAVTEPQAQPVRVQAKLRCNAGPAGQHPVVVAVQQAHVVATEPPPQPWVALQHRPGMGLGGAGAGTVVTLQQVAGDHQQLVVLPQSVQEAQQQFLVHGVCPQGRAALQVPVAEGRDAHQDVPNASR